MQYQEEELITDKENKEESYYDNNKEQIEALKMQMMMIL